MPELAQFTPMSMALADIPSQQPVRAAAEDVKPFAPVDDMANAQKAYTLANAIGEKQDADQERQDKAVLTDYLKSGGNMQTPEGIAKALSDMQGKVSPKSYIDLQKMSQNSLNWNEKLNKYYADMPEQALTMQASKTEHILKALEGPVNVYKKLEETLGSQAAEQSPEYTAAKQATLQYAQQLKDATGKPVFTPDEIEHFKGMTAKAIESELQTTKFHMDRQKEAAELKLKGAQAREHAAKADTLEAGGADVVKLQKIEEIYGKDSDEYKALLTKMKGAGGAFSADDSKVSPAARALAIAQWIQNPSSLRGLPKEYQQNVIKWASELKDTNGNPTPITPEDITNGQAQRKFDISKAGAAGNRAGQMATVEATMPGLINEALDASSKVPRGKFVPWNKLVQMGEAAMSDPDLKRLLVANQSIASEFQQVISRGGTNVTALQEAMHLLQTAESQEAYAAALKQVQREVAINVEGSQKVRSEMGGSVAGKLTSSARPKGEEEGVDGIKEALRQLEASQQDMIPGSKSFTRTQTDIENARAALQRMGAQQIPSATPQLAPTPGATQPVKVTSPADIKNLVKAGKLKVGDVFIGPDGQQRKLKKLPD